MNDNRKRALAAALSQIEKQYGKGSVMRLGAAGAVHDVEAVSTGSLALDLGAGNRRAAARPGGRNLRPRGIRENDAYAQASSRNVRKPAAPPRSWTPSMRWIRYTRGRLGINVDDLLVSQPDTGEQALEITDMLVRSRRGGRRGGGFGRRAYPEGGDRGRDGRHPRGGCTPG